MEFSVFRQQLTEIAARFLQVKQHKDIPALELELAQLEKHTNASDFWQDNETAQIVMRQLGAIRNELESLGGLDTRIESLQTDSSQTDLANDPEIWQLLEQELKSITAEIDKLELSTFLSNKHDISGAIFSIFAGQGGTEANDWAAMLLRMYTRYFNTQGWSVAIIEEVLGTETGVSAISLEVGGRYAYGLLKNEAGTHRLVRNSPFNSAGLRQTSFAGVEVLPIVDQDIDVDIKDDDLDFSAVRSGGAGGQNVNKVASSVRLVHKPSGLVVTSSVARSQSANRKLAMQLLKSRLYTREQEKLQQEKAGLKGEHKEFSWGNQIRNYVLSPYKLVKDLRTGIESNNPDAVLDGEIQEFIDAEVRQL